MLNPVLEGAEEVVGGKDGMIDAGAGGIGGAESVGTTTEGGGRPAGGRYSLWKGEGLGSGDC